ncbi:glycosyltransferase [Luteirhabdus pelagi]|uniref:glycosyltransferase n=1 Tax=Luteirhabdus pelagi TaxID=2792783 RepID=UPI00193AD2D5|nr:glycosyltransferase [Luteirhabdus pelagi]
MDTSHNILLSVRLMTYNHAPYIVQAMESVDRQETSFPYEVVVGDDFSTDGTTQKIESFVSKNPKAHWKLLKREKGGSYHKARQKNGRVQNFYDLLKHCQGKYIALLDGDDYWTDTNKLERQVTFLEQHPDLVGCFHNSKVVDENGTLKWEPYYLGKDGTCFDQRDSVTSLRSGYSTAALVFKREAIVPHLEDFLKIGTDFILEVLITNHGNLCFIDESMSAYRFHEGGVWQGNTQESNNYEVLKRFIFLYDHEPYRSKYNNFLWHNIVEGYEKLRNQTKDPLMRKKFDSELKKFLSFTDSRTYGYYRKRFYHALRYRLKKLRR